MVTFAIFRLPFHSFDSRRQVRVASVIQARSAAFIDTTNKNRKTGHFRMEVLRGVGQASIRRSAGKVEGRLLRASLASGTVRVGEFRLQHGPTEKLSCLLLVRRGSHRCAVRAAARASAVLSAAG